MRRSRSTFASNMAVNGVVRSSKMTVQNGKHVLKEVNGKQYGISEHIKSAQLLVRITLKECSRKTHGNKCVSAT